MSACLGCGHISYYHTKMLSTERRMAPLVLVEVPCTHEGCDCLEYQPVAGAPAKRNPT